MGAAKKRADRVAAPAGANNTRPTSDDRKGAATASVPANGAASMGAPARLPAQLRKLRHWLLWQYGPADSKGRRPKVPYYTDGTVRRGTQGSKQDRTKLATFADALAALQSEPQRWAGLGLAMLADSGLVALDLDNKEDPPTLHPISEAEVRDHFAGTYAERSPSGRGFRVFLQGSMLGIRSGARGIEVFERGQFVTVTGNALEGMPYQVAELTDAQREWMRVQAKRPNVAVADAPAWLLAGPEATAPTAPPSGDAPGPVGDALASPDSGPVPGVGIEQVRDALRYLPASTWDNYDKWLRVGFALHHQFDGHADALELWDEASRCNEKFEPGACAEKWTSIRDETASRVTIRSVLKEARQHGWRGPDRARTDGALRLYNPLRDPPKRMTYMLGAPVWLPDISEQVIFFGRSAAFKSVFVQALCVHMAAGIGLDMQPVEPRVVVYAAEEAPALWDNNLHAWRGHFAHVLMPEAMQHAMRNLERGYLQRIDGNIEGLSDKRADELAALVRGQVERLQSSERPVVVLDPVAEVMLGDESKAQDMRGYIGAGRRIQREVAALVVQVHHTGHSESDRERGSSTLPAAMYARFQVRRNQPTDYVLELECRKHKAGANPPTSRWRVLPVELMPALDEPNSHPLTGVVVEYQDDALPRPTIAEVMAAHDEADLRRLLAEYARDPTVGGKRLRTLLGMGDSKIGRIRGLALERGLLRLGGGAQRAGYGLTAAGMEFLDEATNQDDDLLGD